MAVVGPVPVIVRLVPAQLTVIAELAAICCDWFDVQPACRWCAELPVPGAGRWCPATSAEDGQVGPGATAVGPEVEELSIATAACELPESFTVAPRVDPCRGLGDHLPAVASLTEDEERCRPCRW